MLLAAVERMPANAHTRRAGTHAIPRTGNGQAAVHIESLPALFCAHTMATFKLQFLNRFVQASVE
jgi:hypothetical protein